MTTFSDTVLSDSPLSSFYFGVGWLFGYANSTILVVSLAALLIRRRRRVLTASVSVLSRIVLATGTLCAVAYFAEIVFALSSRNKFERYTFITFVFGPYCWLYWLRFFGAVIAPQLFWFRRSRTNPCISLSIALAIVTPWALEAAIRYLTEQATFLPDSWKH
ncbi:MAG: hypothetical protein QOE70_5319 [Chthoniobacter sp.]|jgi:molybdopterin-containing oxidoreductase family membrane subunit|nr:hypothetical protein [Chthoniobacter sp.]